MQDKLTRADFQICPATSFNQVCVATNSVIIVKPMFPRSRLRNRHELLKTLLRFLQLPAPCLLISFPSDFKNSSEKSSFSARHHPHVVFKSIELGIFLVEKEIKSKKRDCFIRHVITFNLFLSLTALSAWRRTYHHGRVCLSTIRANRTLQA